MTTVVLDHPEQAEARWAAVEQCPACGARDGIRASQRADRTDPAIQNYWRLAERRSEWMAT